MVWVVIPLFLTVIFAGLFYRVSSHWFLLELGSPGVETAQRQCELIAHEIGRALSGDQPGRTGAVTELKSREMMKILLDHNNKIAMVWLCDGDRRITHIMTGVWRQGDGGWGSPPSLAGVSSGLDESSFVAALRKNHPGLMRLDANFTLGNDAGGSLGVMFDATPGPSAGRAAARFSRRLTAVFLAFAIAMTLAAATIVRLRQNARSLERQRDEAAKLAYAGTLASGLAHEIRNPLNALGMQLEMLGEDLEAGETGPMAKRVERIRTGLSGVAYTVQDFLTYAAPGSQRPSLIKAAGVLEPLADSKRASETAPCEIEIQAAPGLSVWCDPHALRQIAENLIGNGLMAQEEAALKRVRVEALARGAAVTLLFDDAGPGVPESERARIFEAFYTTRRQGSGLGLSIARRLARMNGGDLSLDEKSSPLGGARFRVSLPARQKKKGEF